MVVMVPKPKKTKPKKKWSRGKKVVAGVTIAAALGAGYVGGNIARRMERSAAEKRKQVTALRETIVRAKLPVHNPGHFAKICRIYDWNPGTVAGAEKVRFVEGVSKKVGISPARVLATVEVNKIDKFQAQALQTKIRSLQTQLSSWERRSKVSKSASDRRHAKEEVNRIRGQIDRREKIIVIIDAFTGRKALVREIQGTRGSLDAVRGIK